MRILLFLLIAVFSFSAIADDKHKLLRRLVVFPIQVKSTYKKQATDAWWEVRGTLTNKKRFLVASKNFMERKDVFQPRSTLKPADAIILGEILDAHALVSTYLEGRELKMKVYSGRHGRLLWEGKFKLHNSLPVAEQLVDSSKKLMLDMIASIPYQGFVVADSLSGKAYEVKNDQTLIKIQAGDADNIELGDQVQLINVTSDNFNPLFLDGSTVEVFAEGRVVSVDGESKTVVVDKVTSLKDIKQESLVRLPKEHKKMKELFALKESLEKRVRPDYYAPSIKEIEKDVKENKPLAASLTFIINLATFLLLAF